MNLDAHSRVFYYDLHKSAAWMPASIMFREREKAFNRLKRWKTHCKFTEQKQSSHTRTQATPTSEPHVVDGRGQRSGTGDRNVSRTYIDTSSIQSARIGVICEHKCRCASEYVSQNRGHPATPQLGSINQSSWLLTWGTHLSIHIYSYFLMLIRCS